MLINRIFSGNDAVYGLTEKAVNDAVQQHGADKAVGFPHTAYCLPCYYAVTGVEDQNTWRTAGSPWRRKISYDKRACSG